MEFQDANPQSPTPQPFGRWDAAVCAALVLAVAAVFGQTVGHEFVNIDDSLFVGRNPLVGHGLSWHSIVRAFSDSRGGNWIPLTWISHSIDWQLFGSDAAGHHLTNVFLHAAAAVLLFLTLRHATGGLWPSALVAAIFAIHPLRAESVAWVTERKDLLSGVFFMLTLMAYIGYARRRFSVWRYALVSAAFTAGLLAKPMLVTTPLVLLLLDYWPLGRLHRAGGKGPVGNFVRSETIVPWKGTVPFLLTQQSGHSPEKRLFRGVFFGKKSPCCSWPRATAGKLFRFKTRQFLAARPRCLGGLATR